MSRKVGAYGPTFAAVPPLLAQTDMIATLPHLAVGDGISHYNLISRVPPFQIEPIEHCLERATSQ